MFSLSTKESVFKREYVFININFSLNIPHLLKSLSFMSVENLGCFKFI